MNLYSKFKKLPRFIVETLTQEQLNEIVDLQQNKQFSNTKFAKPNPKMRLFNIPMGDGGSYGLFGGGKTDEEDPHFFNKSTTMASNNLNDDPYYLYVKAIAPYMKTNPFLPRVYVLTDVEDSQKLQKPEYKIESLIHFNQLTPEELIAVGYTLSKQVGDHLTDVTELTTFVDQEDNVIDDYQTNYDRPKMDTPINDYRTEKGLITDLANIIGEYLFRLVYGQEITKNFKLQQACYIIRNVMASNKKFRLDLHKNNFMFRRTPYGPQLVITDPLA